MEARRSACLAHSRATGQLSARPVSASSPFQPWASMTPQWTPPASVSVDIGVIRLPTSVIGYTSTGIGNASAASSQSPP
jgi:hypothetical protein